MRAAGAVTLCEPDWEAAPEFGRRDGFLHALRRLWELHPGPATLVETGALREDSPRATGGDGWSTVAWGWYCQETGSRLYTVDIDAGALAVCRHVTAPYAAAVEYVQADSVQFLRDWRTGPGREPGPIDFLYLDSFDFIDEAASERHNRAEAEAALPHLASPSLVLIDDTHPLELGEGSSGPPDFRGKGAQSVPFLVEQDFRLEWYAIGQALLSCGTPGRGPGGNAGA